MPIDQEDDLIKAIEENVTLASYYIDSRLKNGRGEKYPDNIVNRYHTANYHPSQPNAGFDEDFMIPKTDKCRVIRGLPAAEDVPQFLRDLLPGDVKKIVIAPHDGDAPGECCVM